MNEAEVRFEREDRDGVVAVGSYLVDAFKRFGVRLEGDCSPKDGIHFCAVTVTSGIDSLSELTKAESEYFEINGRQVNERLSCQSRIEKVGEIVVMTAKKEKEESKETPEDKSEQYRKDFEEMPLEKKIASLVRLEAIALGETISFVMNSPFKIAEKAMDVMAEFGIKLEREARKASRPEEHRENGSSADEPASTSGDDKNKEHKGKTK